MEYANQSNYYVYGKFVCPVLAEEEHVGMYVCMYGEDGWTSSRTVRAAVVRSTRWGLENEDIGVEES